MAYIIDALIQIVVASSSCSSSASWSPRPAAAGSGRSPASGSSSRLLVYFAFTLVYFPYFWARGGQTPGMRTLHIKVVRDADGGPVSFGSAILRLIGYWINNLLFYIGFLWILVDKRRRGWHDLIAGTCVVEAP